MKDLKQHPFFQMIDLSNEIQKRAIAAYGPKSREATIWGGTGKNNGKSEFLLALRGAHPFLFDKRVTIEKLMDGRAMNDFKDFVEEFSLPFKTTLYLLTDAPMINSPIEEGSSEKALVTTCGYLIQERDPEYFMAWQVATFEFEGKLLPYITQFNIDLKTFLFGMKAADAIGFEVFNKKTQAHYFKETNAIFHLTNSISVKRVGIEHSRKSVSIKNKSASSGFTVVKFDNLYHVADKVEYEYAASAENSEIKWEYSGWRRGHWRAFYVYKDGEKITDSKGRSVVDYGKNGKNRQGEYSVKGYTWVIDTCLGDKDLAEIKMRVVKHK